MKKLALALVCLVSVAFFASCDPKDVIENPEPSIAVIAEEGYLVDGMVIDMNVEYPYGFRVASNPETQQELAKLVIVCGETTLCDSVISGTEFVYRGSIYFSQNDEREIIDSAEIIATVTDADGKTNKASIKVDIDEESELEASSFAWVRANGADGTGLADFGLQWTKNVKDINAVIEPIPGEKVTMYSVPAEKWDEVTTESQLEALFSDGGVAEVIQDYRGVSCLASHDYDDVIATFYGGFYYLIHITKCTVDQRGYVFTIEGEWK